jgi:hypothetical protein
MEGVNPKDAEKSPAEEEDQIMEGVNPKDAEKSPADSETESAKKFRKSNFENAVKKSIKKYRKNKKKKDPD